MHRSIRAASEQSITSGSDFLQLNVAEAPVGGLIDWLTGQLRVAISDGRLPMGSRLPATRILAAELQISRSVVTEAYQRLSEDGHVVGRRRGGTIVVATPMEAPASTPAPKDPPTSALFTAPPNAEIFDALRAAPARIDLSPGLPDLAAFPRSAWLQAERTVLTNLSASDLGYGDPRGAPALRQAVAKWLARYREIRVEASEVIIVAGTAQSLGLLSRLLRDTGIDAIAVEDPGSLGVRQHLRDGGLDTPPIPVDSQGVRVDVLRTSGLPAVMLTPAHQFPTGVVLGGARRRELMAWANEGGLIAEDDYDAEHRYDRPPVPALRSILPHHVFYTGSISKLLAPALRVAWMLAPRKYTDALVEAKRFADLGNPILPQLVLAQLMESGRLERQLRLLRRRHRHRRDTMIEAIRTHLPGATVHGAAAGLHLMITLDAKYAKLADTELAAQLLTHGVKVHPLSWHSQQPHPPGLILGYAANAPTDINEALAILGTLLRQPLPCRAWPSPSAQSN